MIQESDELPLKALTVFGTLCVSALRNAIENRSWRSMMVRNAIIKNCDCIEAGDIHVILKDLDWYRKNKNFERDELKELEILELALRRELKRRGS